jgi:hypothetical protein
MPRTMTV